MKRFLALELVAVLCGAMVRAQVAAPPVPVIQIELYDGSRLNGPALDRGIQFASSLGENVVPWEQIAGVALNKDAGTSFDPADAGDSLELAKGGRLNGRVKSATVGVSTVLGKARLPLAKIKSITCSSSSGEASVAGGGAAPAGSNLKDGLVLYFPLDKADRTVKDESGEGNDGRKISGSFTHEGMFGGSYSVEGRDFILVPNSPSLCPRQVTLSAWVKPSVDVEGDYKMILAKERHGSPAGYWIGYGDTQSGRRFNFKIMSMSGGYMTVETDKVLKKGRWYHVVGTYDGRTQKLYIDGALEGSAKRSSQLTYDAEPVHIGTGSDGLHGWTGLIDDVRIYNRALSEAEIRQLSMRASAVVPAAGAQPGIAPAARTFGIEVGLADQSVVKGTANWTALPLVHSALGTLTIPWPLIDSVIADAGNSTVTLRTGDVLVGRMQFEKANIDSALGRVAISRDQIRSIRVAQTETEADVPPARTGIAPNPAAGGTAPGIPRTRGIRDDGSTKF